MWTAHEAGTARGLLARGPLEGAAAAPSRLPTVPLEVVATETLPRVAPLAGTHPTGLLLARTHQAGLRRAGVRRAELRRAGAWPVGVRRAETSLTGASRGKGAASGTARWARRRLDPRAGAMGEPVTAAAGPAARCGPARVPGGGSRRAAPVRDRPMTTGPVDRAAPSGVHARRVQVVGLFPTGSRTAATGRPRPQEATLDGPTTWVPRPPGHGTRDRLEPPPVHPGLCSATARRWRGRRTRNDRSADRREQQEQREGRGPRPPHEGPRRVGRSRSAPTTLAARPGANSPVSRFPMTSTLVIWTRTRGGS